MVVFNFLFFAFALILLVLSGSGLVKSGSKIARFLRLPEFVVGFILMAVATSLPELFVGITSALKGNPEFALGTVVGSNIANLSLVAGVGVLLARNVRIKTRDAKVDSVVMIIISSLPLILMFIGREISRFDGVILLISFVGYYAHVIHRRKEYSKQLDEPVSRKAGVLYSFLFVISLILIFISANSTVVYGSAFAKDINLPSILVGLFLVAFGTSLPELVFGSKSMMTGHTEMSVGNLIGSNITNSSLIIGVTALIAPIKADYLLFITAGVYMIIVSLVFTSFVESKKFTHIAGVSLLMMYIFFIFIEFYIRSL